MGQRVILHIGLMKSGTTFIQGRLNANRELLAEQGVLFPGPTWARHAHAVGDLVSGAIGRPGAWDALVAEIREHPGTSVVSMEFLGPMRPRRIARLVADLEGLEVHAVATVRDLGRTVPAMWQETLKNRQTWTWPEFVSSVEHGGAAHDRFWRQHAADRIVRTWVEGLGQDRVAVVTVPPPGAPSELLWDRFREAAGIAEAPWVDAPRSNESLGIASTSLMRLLNVRVGDLDALTYNRLVKAFGKHVLGRHRAQEQPIGFAVPPWLHERSRRLVEALRDSGVRVVGDLGDLTPLDVPGADPAAVDTAEVLEAALAGLEVLLRDGGAQRYADSAKRSRRGAGRRARRTPGSGPGSAS